MDDLLPLSKWCVIIVLIMFILVFIFGWIVNKKHPPESEPKSEPVFPIPEIKEEKKVDTKSPEDWVKIIVAFFIGLVVMMVFMASITIPKSEMSTIDGVVIDRGLWHNRYYVMVQLDDQYSTVLNLTVNNDMWLRCGYGTSITIYYFNGHNMIENTTA